MGFRILSSDWFLCGFNIVDHLGPLHEGGQAMDLRGH